MTWMRHLLPFLAILSQGMKGFLVFEYRCVKGTHEFFGCTPLKCNQIIN